MKKMNGKSFEKINITIVIQILQCNLVPRFIKLGEYLILGLNSL